MENSLDKKEEEGEEEDELPDFNIGDEMDL